MAEKRDYYEILGIGRDADAAAIKKAYRKLAKKYHPDQNAGNTEAEQKFKEATEAYAVLSDPEKKKMYDQFGHAAFTEGGAGYEAYGNQNGGYGNVHFESGDMEDIFGDLFGDMFRGGKGENGGFHYYSYGDGSGFRDGGFGREFREDHIRRKGRDLRADVSVSFDEAAFGCSKIISLQDGSRQQSLEVRIPAGIDSGQSVRLRGKGMPGTGGGEAGDLLLEVHVGKKPGYERKEMDLYTTASIPFTTAVFGGEAMVSTLYGNVMCKIPEGTQSGAKIRLRGKGIVSMKDPQRHGDQYVTIQIQVPRHLSSEAKQKLKEFAGLIGENPKQHVA
ncbi:DnaJ C-terminal domain-containing protein [Anaerolentibacter hominis]|uniref:DnaJ C-terminal domain-containing protein n=1 Tax=Anaerolentibacter hominis TaxID=3079009 RepID=UPI0031B86421